MVPKPTSTFLVILVICTLALCSAPPGATPVYAAQEDAALFQSALSGLGQWLNYGQQGPVWRPSQVDRNWRPYTNGRWVPTQEGYVFETDEPWGWATYHYGNWMPTNEHGWVWAPGRTWYPHTVNWRTNDQNVGWAPVPPPEYTTSDNYYSGGYSEGEYTSPTGMNSYGSSMNGISPTSWIFTRASDFLLGYGQPYASSYSYANAGVLAAPQYIPTMYQSTMFVNNYVYPSYAPRACYNWGPPVTYITKVTNIKNIEIDRRYKDLRLAHLRNVMPPANLAHRHPAWRKILPAAGETRQSHIRSVSNFRTASGGLNRPDAIPAPLSLKRRNAEGIPQSGEPGPGHLRPQINQASSTGTQQISGTIADQNSRTRPSGNYQVTRPPDPVKTRGRYSSQLAEANPSTSGTARRQDQPSPANPSASTGTAPGDVRKQPLAAVPTHYQDQASPHRSYQRYGQQATQENQLRRQPDQRLQQEQQRAEQEQRMRQQQRLEMARQQQARICQEQQQQQARLQQQIQVEQQRRQAEMQQQRQAEMQRHQQMQQQRQVEMQRVQQVQQQQQMVRQAPPPPPRQAPPPQRQKKQDNQN